MVDFKIRRGLSTILFSEPGVVNPRLVIEEGCWYLCSDTAELFLGISGESGLTLKRVNGEKSSATDTPTHTPSLGPSEPDNTVVELEMAVSELQETVAIISDSLANYVTKEELTKKDYATRSFVTNKIAEAQLSGTDGNVDLSGFVTKDELNDYLTHSKTTQFAEYSQFPTIGEANMLYIALDRKAIYAYIDTEYVCMGNAESTHYDIISGGKA
jgi:hypothetical protein